MASDGSQDPDTLKYMCRGRDHPHIFRMVDGHAAGPCLCGKVRCEADAIYIQYLESTWRYRVSGWLWRHKRSSRWWWYVSLGPVSEWIHKKL